MKTNFSDYQNQIQGKYLIRYYILIYWVLFWLFNIIDKIIGGAHFLFVGKDRFAQIERFFDSLGLANPVAANLALIITACFESFALVFCSGSLYYLTRRNIEKSRLWFFVGTISTLITFTYFSVGDQFFGDHFELLEHALFWFIGILSWIVFTNIHKIYMIEYIALSKPQFMASTLCMAIISFVTVFSVFWHNHSSFVERTRAVESIKINDYQYKIKFPFLAGSKAFENSLTQFKLNHPSEKISYIYTAPNSLRLGESDGLIIYINTIKK